MATKRRCDKCFGPTELTGNLCFCADQNCYYHLRSLDGNATRSMGGVTLHRFAPVKSGGHVGLPDDDAARKALPIFDGVLMYFPDAIAAIAEVSRIGNEQHNSGEPLHWARGKSMDQYNTAIRHMMDHRMGKRYNGKARHLANAAWRILAALQLDIEAERDDTRRKSQDTCRQATEPAPSVLPETSAERAGFTRARLPRKPQGSGLRHRNKGSRKRTHR